LLIEYQSTQTALELKSFSNRPKYLEALEQAAQYAHSLGLDEISLLFFIEHIDDKNRQLYEVDHLHPETNVTVKVVFAETGV